MPRLGNNFLINARRERNDEFYTQYCDIESEMKKFEKFLSGKIIYCPTDHHTKSNFPVFFRNNFERLGIRGLYTSDIDDGAYYYDGKNETRIGGPVDIRGDRFIEYMCLSDVIITNPPFSLFVKFLDNIINYEKDFIIIGQQNTISTKSVFSYIMENKVYVDYGFKGIAGWFDVPDDYVDSASAGEHIKGKIRVSGVVWYTSYNVTEDNDSIELTKSHLKENGEHDYEKYPVFDNFRKISGLSEDAICVDKVKDIPYDWNGYMGVPISFFGKYNPNQFELIQLDHYGPLGNQDNCINGKQKYRRIYIKLKNNVN